MDKYYVLIMLGVLVLLFVFLTVRQRKQEKKNLDALNNFKVGDKVITHIGIYGKIKRIYNTSFGKTCILEIGNTNKVDVEMDMRYISGYDEKVAMPDEPAPAKQEAPANPENNEQNKEAAEVPPESKPQKSKNKKSSKKK